MALQCFAFATVYVVCWQEIAYLTFLSKWSKVSINSPSLSASLNSDALGDQASTDEAVSDGRIGGCIEKVHLF